MPSGSTTSRTTEPRDYAVTERPARCPTHPGELLREILGIAGVEGWWLTGDTLDFGGNAAGDLEEWYIGIFGSLAF